MRIPLLCNFGAVVLKFYSGRCRFTKICYNGDKEENQSEWIRLLCGDKKGDIISRYVDFTKIYNRQVRIYGRTREAVLSTTDMQG